jgi:hypothetical protein
MTLNWNRVESATKYRLLLFSKSSKNPIRIDKDIKDPSFFIKDLTAGTYEWKVASIDKEGKLSKYSAPRVFKIQKPKQIEWLHKSDLFEYVKIPEVKVKWSKTAGAKKWKIEYAQNQNFKNAISSVVSSTYVKLPLKLDGVYYIRVYALNDDEKRIAKAPIKVIELKEKPLPKAPKFRSNIPSRLIASSSGKLKLAFNPLTNREDRIILKVIDQNGEVIRLHRMQSVQEIIKGLMPGKYYLSAQVEDKYERRSLPSDSKELVVPKVSYVKAPEVQNILIK